MKKITFAIASLGSGGAERVVSSLSNELAARGYEVSIVLVVENTQYYSINSAIKIYCLDCEKDQDKNVVTRIAVRLLKLRRILKQLQPDVVISFMSETNIDVCLASVGLKIPVIASERNDPAIDPASRLKRLLRRFAYLRGNGFVFQTPDAQAYFSKRIQARSRIILNPLTGLIPEPFDGEREKRIVAVGRLNVQKNYPMLLNAFRDFSRKYSDYTLEIYGIGDLEEEIRSQIQELGLSDRVVLKGFCKNVHESIRKAAFFVMSSDFEGLPNALIEAMALGLPCISTDCPCGGPRMLIRNGENGLLVPVGDALALEQAMCTLAEDPAAAQAMGQAATSLREQIEVTKITDQWVDAMLTYGKFR